MILSVETERNERETTEVFSCEQSKQTKNSNSFTLLIIS